MQLHQGIGTDIAGNSTADTVCCRYWRACGRPQSELLNVRPAQTLSEDDRGPPLIVDLHPINLGIGSTIQQTGLLLPLGVANLDRQRADALRRILASPAPGCDSRTGN